VSLTTGRGPLSPAPAGQFSVPMPTGVMYVEPHLRRIRARVGERTVIDTERAKLVHRPGLPTSYAFPASDVPPELATLEPAVPGHVAVPWGSVDAWYEEDVHLTFNSCPKNPYHRVDCLRASRPVKVTVGDVCLVDTTDTLMVCETSLRPRLYVAKHDARVDLLTVSESTSWCSYKGTATWWDAHVGGETIHDVAWSYEEPLDESKALGGMLSFDERIVTVLADLPRS
jgi:uncharacterized protein (DUF427 family)